MQIGQMVAGRRTAAEARPWQANAPWVVGFAALLAISAQLRFYPPGSTVPVTMQTAVVLLCGFWLRPRLAAAAVGVYLAAGFALAWAAPGTSVFAAFALGKTTTLGYLLGFLASAVVVSAIVEQLQGLTFGRALAAGLLGTCVIFAFGLAWLTVLTGSAVIAVQQGLAPFAGWALAKTAAVAALASAVQIRR
jgi:biotin transport system substrate-specific component